MNSKGEFTNVCKQNKLKTTMTLCNRNEHVSRRSCSYNTC